MVADMSEPTYTIKQFEKAMDKCHSSDTGCYARTKKLILSELQRPAYVPEEGEIVCGGEESCDRVFRWCRQDKAYRWPELRPLNRAECGPVGRALGVAVDSMQMMQVSSNYRTHIKETLAEIKRLEQSDE